MDHQDSREISRNHRNDLAGEHKFGDVGQITIAFLFGVTWIGDSFMLNYTTFLNQYVSNFVRIPIAIVFFSISFFLASMGLSTVFGKKRKDPGVIRRNVFGVVRHPIYLSEILLYLGFLMLSISLTATLVLGFAIMFLHYIAKYEERLLLGHFGEEYSSYMRDVPMWIPRMWKGKR